MDKITTIKWNNNLDIKHSKTLNDKRDCYEVEYDVPYFSYDLISKRLMTQPTPYVEGGTWKNVLHVSTKKFNLNPEYYIHMLKNYRRPNDGRKWLNFE